MSYYMMVGRKASLDANSFVAGLLSDIAPASSGNLPMWSSSTTPPGSDPNSVFTGNNYTAGGVARAVTISLSVTWVSGSTLTITAILGTASSGLSPVATSLPGTGTSGTVTVNYTTTGTEDIYPSVAITGSCTIKVNTNTIIEGTW